MIGIGAFEIFLILVVLLLVVGPERMPEVVRFLSRVLREIRTAAGEMREQVETMADLGDLHDQAKAVQQVVAAADVREDLRRSPPDAAPRSNASDGAAETLPPAPPAAEPIAEPAPHPGDAEASASREP